MCKYVSRGDRFQRAEPGLRFTVTPRDAEIRPARCVRYRVRGRVPNGNLLRGWQLTDRPAGRAPQIYGFGRDPELREGYADLGDVSLHYVEVGEGPLIILLHGFPEFWFGWRLQIRSHFHRGTRFASSHPTCPAQPVVAAGGREGYDTDHLTADIRALVKNAVPSPRSPSAMTGAEASRGPPR
jgi:hypothetical protein